MKQTVLIVCPDCAAVNRGPSTRLAQLPSCGRCHAQLFRGKSVALDADSFERHIARGSIAVLVDFWAAVVRTLPYLVLFLQGREIARHCGVLAAADIERWVRDLGVS